MLATGTEDGQAVFALRIIDRRTGSALRRDGRAATILTRTPSAAAAEILRDRDPAHWDVQVERLFFL